MSEKILLKMHHLVNKRKEYKIYISKFSKHLKMRITEKNVDFDYRRSNCCSASEFFLVESMGDVIPRTSQLDPDVRVSVHPAPDVLS
ncbi:hypothetical protein, partial [Nostoc sp.]|uniref:hypothetical protein n=1 Tax=Nostoc sp. TaxID=1180 RepID=UPI002FF508D6